MDKNVKNVLAGIGAIAVVKTAPVLALGAAIGAVATNMDKVKEMLVEYGVMEYAEEECECCKGGPCTCEGECACDSAEEPETWEEEIPDAKTAEDVSAEDAETPTEEPDAEAASAEEGSLEDLRAKAKAFLDAAKAFAETAVNDMK